MERIVIIGGTGFVGEYFLKNLSGKKNVKLIAVYRNSHTFEKLNGVEYIQLDGSEDFEGLVNVLKESDYLVILSRPNLQLIQNIIKSNLKFKKIIYTSTLLIYPNSKLKQNENSNLEPANQYEKDKVNEERKLSEFARSSGNKLTIARLTNVYGDKKNRALVHWILSAVVNDQEFKLNNKGFPTRDFIFVEDVASYLELLIFLPQKQIIEIFNVCTGQGFTINDVIQEVETIASKKVNITQGVMTDEKMIVLGDNNRIIQATGFKPKYDLRSGLRKAYQNYLKNEH